MTISLDLSDERDLAIAVKYIRNGDSGLVSHQTLMINLIWSVHEFAQEADPDEIEITDQEANEIIEQLPTSLETEQEHD